MGEPKSKDLKKEALLAALQETAGSLSAQDHPEWATGEKVYAWEPSQMSVYLGIRQLATMGSGQVC